MVDKMKRGFFAAWLRRKALMALVAVAAAVVAVGGSLALVRSAEAAVSVTGSVNWALYQIAEGKALEYTGNDDPLLLVFSTEELPDKYNSGSARYGNGLKKVRGSGSDSQVAWDTTKGYGSDANVPWINSGYGSRIYAVQTANDSKTIVPKIADQLFHSCNQLRDVSGIRYWNTSQTTSMKYLFSGCDVLEDLSPVSDWDVSQVTSMNNMFWQTAVKEIEIWDWMPADGVRVNKTFNGCKNLTTIYCNHAWNASPKDSPFGDCSTKLTSLSSGKVWNTNEVSSAECNPTTGYFTGNKVVQVPRGISLVYNGHPQVGVVQPTDVKLTATGQESGGFHIDASGNAVATDAGTYTARAEIALGDATWSSGGTAARDVSFTISKAELFFEIPSTQLEYSGSSLVVPVSFTSDSEGLALQPDDVGSIKATSDTTGVTVGDVLYYGDGKTIYVQLGITDPSLESVQLSVGVDAGAQNITGANASGIVRIKLAEKPVGRSLTYTGEAQIGVPAGDGYTLTNVTPAESGGGSSTGAGLDESHNAVAVHAGTYDVTWSAGSGASSDPVQFTIAKATPSIEVTTSDGTIVTPQSGLTIEKGRSVTLNVRVSYPDGHGTTKYANYLTDEIDDQNFIRTLSPENTVEVSPSTATENTYSFTLTATGEPNSICYLGFEFNTGGVAETNGDFLGDSWTTRVDIEKAANEPAAFPTLGAKTFNGEKKTWEIATDGFTLDGAVTPVGDVASGISDYGVEGNSVFATHAGTYTVLATLDDDYVWADGVDDTTRPITFTINKATPVITFEQKPIMRYVGDTEGEMASATKPELEFRLTFPDDAAYGDQKGKPIDSASMPAADAPRIETALDDGASPVLSLGELSPENGTYTAQIAPKAQGSGSITVFAGSSGTASDFATVSSVLSPVTVKDLQVAPKGDTTFTGERYNGIDIVLNDYNRDEIELGELTATDGALAATDSGVDVSSPNALRAYGTHAGTYTVTASLVNKDAGTCWHDGTTADKNLTFTINKANSTIISSPASVDLEAGGTGSAIAYLHLTNVQPATSVYAGLKDGELTATETQAGNLTVTSTRVAQGANAGKFAIQATATDGMPPAKNPATVTIAFAGNGDINKPADGTLTVRTATHTLRYQGNGASGGTVPAASTYVKGEQVTLESPNPMLTHAPMGGRRVVFLGWSQARQTQAIAKGQPANTIDSVTFDTRDIDVYAVWAYDSDGDGTADVNETPVSLSYDPNGGSGGPTRVSGLVPGDVVTLDTANVPAHGQEMLDGVATDVVFAGWSETQAGTGTIYTKDANKAAVEQLIATTHTMGRTDEKVWAVWAYDENHDGVPDFSEATYRLTYDVNGGDEGSVPVDTATYLAGSVASLKQYAPGAAERPAHGPSDGTPVAFVGWTVTADSTIYGRGDKANAERGLVTSVTFGKGDQTVYARWALDANGNDLPDFDETPHTLSFDPNGGDTKGETFPAQNLLVGESTELPKPSWTKAWSDASGTHDAIFAGWSPVASPSGLAADGIIRASQGSVYRTLIPGGSMRTMGNADETLYAIYAADANHNGKPDCTEDLASIAYYPNGGANPAGTPAYADTKPFYTDPAKHVVGNHGETDVELLSVAEGQEKIQRAGAILVGWSASENPTLIETQVEYASAGVITAIDMPAEATDDTVKVYAVWAADVNGNGEPDYLEDHYDIAYDANGGEGAPTGSNDYVAGELVELDSETTPTHDAVHGKTVMFVGWCETDTDGKVYGDDATDVPRTVTHVTMPASEKTVWAVWAEDGNDNGTPDYDDTKLTLTYGLNGGTRTNGQPPANVKVLAGIEYPLWTAPSESARPTRADGVFIGWSATKQEGLLDAAPSDLISSVTLDASTDASGKTVYALWAKDANGNGVPDYGDEKTTLHYDYNAEGVTPPETLQAVQDKPYLRSGGRDVVAKLWEDANAGKASAWSKGEGAERAVFVGWSETLHEATLATRPSDEHVTVVTQVRIGDVNPQNVYAVWAADVNANGAPDYSETLVPLVYDANGGNLSGAQGLANNQRYLPGITGVELWKQEGHSLWKRSSDNALFAGWSATKPAGTVTSSEELTSAGIISTVDIPATGTRTVYAVWAANRNNDDTPDYEETTYKLAYDLNGGTGTAPTGDDAYIKGDVVSPLAAGTGLSHAQTSDSKSVIFVGWSREAQDVLDKRASAVSVRGLLLDGVTFESSDITVHAVWAVDTDGNGTPDYAEAKRTLTYDGNGAISGIPRDANTYVKGETVELQGYSDLSRGDDTTVCVGWSLTDVNTIYGKNADKATVEEDLIKDNNVTFGDEDITVHAVWAYDTDGDGTPDYEETKITLTFDANGGKVEGTEDAASIDPMTVIAGESVHLPTYDELKWVKTWDGYTDSSGNRISATYPAIFVGWTESPAITDVLLASDKDPGGAGNSSKLIATDSYTVPSDASGTITLYAAYAADENDDATPDYLSASVHVEYWANGGEPAGGDGWFDDTTNLVYRCGHHHVPGEEGVTLLSLSEGKGLVAREKAVLIGWSKTQHTAVVTSEDEEEACGIVSSITMDSGTANTRVYAVWVVDANGNGIADYSSAEPKYTLTYDANGGDDASMPAAVDGLLGDTTVTLATYSPAAASRPTHSPVSGTGVLFIGWTGRDNGGKVYGFADKGNVPATIAQVRIGSADATVYALWAFDENGNGVADCMESAVTLRYEMNGGTKANGRPADASGLSGTTVTLWQPAANGSDSPVRADAVFLGWSGRLYATPFASEPTPGIVATQVTLGRDGASVYAVWAEDENHDSVPDYAEGQHVTLTFDINGGSGQNESAIGHRGTYEASVLKGTTVNFPSFGTGGAAANQLNWVKAWDGYQNDAGIWIPASNAAILCGWSEASIGSVILGDDTEAGGANLSKDLISTEGYKATADATFYAAYAADEANDGEPDYSEGHRHVAYFANGGTTASGGELAAGTAFYTCPHDHKAGDTVTLLTKDQADYFIKREGAVLVGWSKKAIEGEATAVPTEDGVYLFDANGDAPTFEMDGEASDTNVYAIWAKDENANGVADYAEVKTTLHYDLNGGEKPSSAGDELDDKEYLRSTPAVPTTVPLWTDSKTGADAWHKGEGDERAVFVGWSLAKHEVSLTRTPAESGVAIVTEVTIGSTTPLNVYAVWAIDSNGNGKPDYSETVTLTYDANKPADRDAMWRACPAPRRQPSLTVR